LVSYYAGLYGAEVMALATHDKRVLRRKPRRATPQTTVNSHEDGSGAPTGV